jgi:hypothetical protein
MRTPLLLLAAGLSAAVALSGCGGSGDDSSESAAGSTSASPDASSSAAAGSSATSAEAAAFCAEAGSMRQQLDATVATADSDPTQLAPALQKWAAEYATVDAPQEIAPDWATLVGGIQQLATAAQGIDFTAPTAAQQLQASVGGLSDQISTATTNVSAYASAHCGTTAAPSS